MNGLSFFSSWSGGKDACLALYRAIKCGAKPAYLFTMMEQNSTYSRAHRLPISIIEKQAELLGIPLITRSATWDTYEELFIDGLKEMRKHGIHNGVFGDIDIDGHLEWVQKTCQSVNITSHHPLWEESRNKLIHQFVDLGFEAKIVVIKDNILPKSFLGRTFNKETIAEIERLGVDACGEEGEFHTLVTDGPIFSQSLKIKFGEQLSHNGASFQLLSLA